jgi:hypothetical protein
MQFSQINFLAVAVGTVAAFSIGIIWYAPPVFGRTWRKYVGVPREKMQQARVAGTFGPAIVLMYLMGVVLAALLPMDTLRWTQGAFGGMVMGAGMGATALAIHYIFARRAVHLFLIDAGYTVLALAISGAIIAAMT